MRFFLSLFVSVVLPVFAVALPSANSDRDVAAEFRGKRSFYRRDGVDRTVFEHEATGAKIDFVTDSGICETTPGVKQYSGYLSVGSKSCGTTRLFELSRKS